MSATRDEVTAGNALAMHLHSCMRCHELEPCERRDRLHAAAALPAMNRNAWRREREAGSNYAMHLDDCGECRQLNFCSMGGELLAQFQLAMEQAPRQTAHI